MRWCFGPWLVSRRSSPACSSSFPPSGLDWLTGYLTEFCFGSTGQRNTLIEYLCWGAIAVPPPTQNPWIIATTGFADSVRAAIAPSRSSRMRPPIRSGHRPPSVELRVD